MLALAVLAGRIAGARHGGGAALMAVVVTLCIPAYHAAALLMTIDGPMLACWAVALLAAWRLHEACGVGESSRTVVRAPNRLGWAVVLGAALGIGFLFKYTILLAALGIALFFVLSRRNRTRPAVPVVIVACVVFFVCASPVVIWNAQRGWPTVAHLLGHLGVGGSDLPAGRSGGGGSGGRAYSAIWTLEYLGVLVALAGPIVLAMWLAVRTALRKQDGQIAGPLAHPRGSFVGDSGHPLGDAAGFALCGCLPVLLTYLGVSFFTDVEGNWPIGAWVSLIPLTAVVLVHAMDDYRARISAWLALPRDQRPRAGVFRSRPETAFQLALHFGLGYGVVAALGMMLLGPLSRAPLVGPLVPIERISGARELAAAVDRQREALERETGKPALIIGARYTHAALLAFYCRGRPRVFSAASRLGDRRSAYDDFADSDLTHPDLLGRPAVLIDGGRSANVDRWARAVRFNTPPLLVETLGETGSRHARSVFAARGYAGVAP